MQIIHSIGSIEEMHIYVRQHTHTHTDMSVSANVNTNVSVHHLAMSQLVAANQSAHLPP